MSRRKVDVRREEILQAAVEEVQQRGFANTRIGDVADSLGISSGLVFYHFGTKDALLAAAFEFACAADLARLDRTVARAKSSTDAVRRILSVNAPQGSAPGWTIWVDAWSESLRSQEMREASRRLDQHWKDVLARAIRQGVTDGEFSCNEPDSAAWRLSAILDGLAVQVLVHRNLTKRQMANWLRLAAAGELGIDPAVLA